MEKHGTNPENIAVTKSEIKQLGILIGYVVSVLTAIISHYFLSLSKEEKNRLLQNKESLGKNITSALASVFAGTNDPFVELKIYWRTIYKKHFDIDANFSNVFIPLKPIEGKWRLLFVAQELMIDHAYIIYTRTISRYNAKMWKDDYYSGSIDYKIADNIRNPKDGSYAIWVRDEQESDEKFCGQSTEQADPNKLIGETLLERMIHGIVYFIETKKHLDEKGTTLCSGSRTTNGDVPNMHWYPDSHMVGVRYSRVDCINPNGGIRQVISNVSL